MKVEDLLREFTRLEIPDESGLKRLQECLDLAEQKHLSSLREKLQYLNDYAGDRSKGCRLYHDFAPYSLGFVMLDANGKRWFNGGLIYYGAGEMGFGTPQFSVRGSGDRDAGWEINT